MPITLTRQKAQAHEALYPRVEKLTRQIEAIAARRPSAPVPPAARAIADALLFDAQAFATAARALPALAPDVAGLATQLGQALAALDAFEAAHAGWQADLNCFAWRLASGATLPVQRLRPHVVETGRNRQLQREGARMRRELIRRIDAKFYDGYDQGYRDAQNGVPHQDANL
jgi:hypothetical protein